MNVSIQLQQWCQHHTVMWRQGECQGGFLGGMKGWAGGGGSEQLGMRPK